MKLSSQTKRSITLATALAFATCFTGCLKSGSDDDDDAPAASPVAVSPAPAASTTTTTTTTTETAEEETTADTTVAKNALSAAFPGTLALSVFSPEGGAALTDNGVRLSLADAFDPNAKSLAEKVADQEKIASGEASSCLPDALSKQFTKGNDESCYEFDQDMIYGSNDITKPTPNWLGTRNGKASNGEACLVAFTRNQVSQVVAMVDQTLGFGMAAICQYRKLNGKDTALPDVGKSIDLAPALKDLFGSKISVGSATLERLADAKSHPVYRILIRATMANDSFEREVGIIHSPEDDENKEYSGTLYTIMAGVPSFGGAAAALPAGQTQKYQLLSITYDRSVESSGTYLSADLRSAQMHPSIAEDAISSAGILDFNYGTNVATGTLGAVGYGNYTGFNQANDAVDGITFIAFDLNTDTSEGTLAYWKNPGGNYYENARGFNISIAENSAGDLTGCATSGAASTDFTNGISIRRYLNSLEASSKLTLAPKGFWHPFMNSNASGPQGAGSTFGSGTDSIGDYLTRVQSNPSQNVKWYVPLVADAALASSFVTNDTGSLITRQCFKLNSANGLYEIDTSAISAAAGFELLDTGSTANAAKFIALPAQVAPPVDSVK